MTRKWRPQYEGAFYHVMSRGDEGNHIFADDGDKQYFLDCVGKGAEKYSVIIYAYCIMSNHYHLLIETPLANISSFMHYVGTAFASYLSRKGWIGHVFSGRFKAVCAERDGSIMPLSRYVHRNPLEAGMVRELEDYSWSSYRCYLGLAEAPRWLDIGCALNRLSPDLSTARGLYRQVVLGDWEGLPDRHEDVIKAGSIIGSWEFLSRVIAKTGGKGSLDQVTGKALLSRPLRLEGLLGAVCDYYGLEKIEDAAKSNKKWGRRPRSMFIYLAKKHTAALNREIGEAVKGLTPSGVTKQYIRTVERISRDGEEARIWREEEEAILSIVKP